MDRYIYRARRHQRALYQTETENMTLLEREVFLFKKYLETVPIHMYKGDLLAGWYGYEGQVPRELSAALERWQNAQGEDTPERKQEKEAREKLRTEYCWKVSGFDTGHTLMDFDSMIRRGTRSYLKDVENRLQELEAQSSEAEYLRAMKAALEAGEVFFARFADKAADMAAQAENEQERANFLRMESACRKVPMEPAEDFYEALQSAFLLYSLICASDDGWVSVSFGSFDQFMLPYYLKSQKDGVSEEEMISWLVQLFKMLDQYEGQDCVLSIGGMDRDGNDLTNDLSDLLLKAEKTSMTRSPLFVVRVSSKTPEKIMDEAVCTKLFEMGQPTFYSETECKKAVMGRGIDEEEAFRYQISTCMQMEIPGAQVNASWGIVTNLHLPLELALNGGKPLHGQLPIELKTPPKTQYANTEEVYEQFTLYLKELFAQARKWEEKDIRELRQDRPNPWLSALTEDCIARGRDRWDGGARYQSITVENFGFANAADALGAVEKLVFEEKKYTLEEMLEAARNNYEGFEEVYGDVMKCPKYGMNIAGADEKARRILSIVADVCEENRHDNVRYLPSLHTLDMDVEYGRTVGAMLDGRLFGEPFNKNAGPVNAARKAGPTAMALSACKLNQKRLSGGQALDVHFSVGNLDEKEKKKKIAAFIKTYLFCGGLQMQVNALSSQTLKKAYANPEQYQDLIVRIGGHSRYYNELPDAVKKEFIHRISVEEGAGL